MDRQQWCKNTLNNIKSNTAPPEMSGSITARPEHLNPYETEENDLKNNFVRMVIISYCLPGLDFDCSWFLAFNLLSHVFMLFLIFLNLFFHKPYKVFLLGIEHNRILHAAMDDRCVEGALNIVRCA